MISTVREGLLSGSQERYRRGPVVVRFGLEKNEGVLLEKKAAKKCLLLMLPYVYKLLLVGETLADSTCGVESLSRCSVPVVLGRGRPFRYR